MKPQSVKLFPLATQNNNRYLYGIVTGILIDKLYEIYFKYPKIGSYCQAHSKLKLEYIILQTHPFYLISFIKTEKTITRFTHPDFIITNSHSHSSCSILKRCSEEPHLCLFMEYNVVLCLGEICMNKTSPQSIWEDK